MLIVHHLSRQVCEGIMATQVALRGYLTTLCHNPENRGWQLNQEIIRLEAELEMKRAYHQELEKKFRALIRQDPEITPRFLQARIRAQAITHHVEELQMKLQRLYIRARFMDCSRLNEIGRLFR